MLNVKVHDSIIRKRLNKYDLLNMREELKFARLRLKNATTLLELLDVVFTDELKVSMFGHNAKHHIW